MDGAHGPDPLLLVIGRNGQIGWELMRALQPLGQVRGLAREELDVTRHDEVAAALRSLRPDVVINATGYTAVDRAEQASQAPQAWAVNAAAPAFLADQCARTRSLYVHYSTDYVFPGTDPMPLAESAPTGPVNRYGSTKLEGDRAVLSSAGPHLVIRVGWVYSLRRHNFLRTLVRQARAGMPLRVVDDQFGAPTPADFIADVTAHLIARRRARPDVRGLDGCVNVACSGRTHWLGFAEAILDHLAEQPARREDLVLARRPRIEPISSAALGLPARRPAHSLLDITRLSRTWALHAPRWDDALKRVLGDA